MLRVVDSRKPRPVRVRLTEGRSTSHFAGDPKRIDRNGAT